MVSGGAGTDSSAGAELAVDDQRWKQNKDWKILAPRPPRAHSFQLWQTSRWRTSCITDQERRGAQHGGEQAVRQGGGRRHGEHGVSGAHQHGVARVRRGQGVGGGRGGGAHQVTISRRRRWQG